MTEKSNDLLESIMHTAREVLPDSIGDNMKSNLRSAIQDVLNELDVVSRDDFETQTAVLQKTRAKVDKMEEMLDRLEKELKK